MAFGADTARADSSEVLTDPTPEQLAEAKKLFAIGTAAYKKGSYGEAIVAWKRSYKLSGRPLIFESIAHAYERMGDFEQAKEYLMRWRQAAPPEEHELIDARLANLDAQLEDGKDAEPAPTSPDPEPVVAEPPPPPEEGGWSVPGVVLTSAGLAAVAVGITLDVIAVSDRPDPDAVCRTSEGKTLCRASERDAIESSDSLAVVGDVLWIAGALTAVAGVGFLLFDEPSSGDEGPSARLVPVLSGESGGLWLTGRY